VRPEQGCLFYAAYTAVAVSRRGVRAVLQAGSASWLFKAAERDDGVGPTHYSYVFEANSRMTALRLGQGMLPELHCWAAIPQTGEIIDLTTRHLPGFSRWLCPARNGRARAAGLFLGRCQGPARWLALRRRPGSHCDRI